MNLSSDGAIGILSRGIKRIPHLSAFLGEEVVLVRRLRGKRTLLAGVAAWGRRPSARKARAFAQAQGIKRFLNLEDGFLRSLGLGVAGAAPLSLVVDDVGIYYDATVPSRLESLIAEAHIDDSQLAEARHAIDLILRHRLSKYNHAGALTLPPRSGGSRVLVIDQTVCDVSVRLGGAGPEAFQSMLAAARSEHPQAEIWVKAHPDVLSGQKQGYLCAEQMDGHVRLIAEDCCPLSLIAQFDHIYVVTSQVGFEALMLGKPVTCFGQPWYAGWGLTDDRHPGIGELRVRRPQPRTLEQLFGAAYLQYARYIQPATGKPGTLFDVIDWLARNKRIGDETRGTLYCVGMSPWKRAIVAPFLRTPSNRLRFVRELAVEKIAALPDDSRLVVWGSKEDAFCKAAMQRGIPVMHLEDGFVRSAGLGSDLHGPLSLVLDGTGIYYDPASGSQLEKLLSECRLDEGELSRARNLKANLVRLRISKYNVGMAFALGAETAGRRVLLVPGQVEDDASIRTGSPIVFRNRDLLENVRRTNPDAWIVYKPHPDVVAGHRKGAIPADMLAGLVDQLATEANISDCIAAADEVHTMTSLAGFEALLAGKVVHCYGGPFYSGWGLTTDYLQQPHRRRRLSIDELVFVALCRYPRYRLPHVDGFCAVEDVMHFLAADGGERAVQPGSCWLGRQWRKARQLLRVFVLTRLQYSAGGRMAPHVSEEVSGLKGRKLRET